MNLRAIVFQSDGGVSSEYYKDEIKNDGISFYEGAVVSDTTTTNTSKQTNMVETIKINHYTGRTDLTLAKPK
jgi:hypothetical protein